MSANKSTTSKLAEIVKYLDFFSEGVNLNVGGHSVFRTLYGSIFTIVYLGIMLYIVISSMEKYLDKTKPLAVGENYSAEVYPEINLYDNKLLPVIIAYSDETQFIKADKLSKYFTIFTEKIVWTASTNEDTKEAQLQKYIQRYPTVPCNQLSDEQKDVYTYMGTNSYTYKTLLTYGLCSMVPKDITVKGETSDDYFSLLAVKLLPCSLLSGCATEAEMYKVNFQIILPASNLDVSDSESPHNFTIRADEVYYVTPMQRQMYLGKLKEFRVRDYEGVIPSWTEVVSAFDIGTVSTIQTARKPVLNCTAADAGVTDNQNCLPYIEFLVQSGSQKIINKRTYVTLSQTLSTIGGINSVIFIVMLLLYGPINDMKRKDYMTRKIYSLVGVNEDDLEKGLEYLEKRKNASNHTVLEGESPEKLHPTDGAQGSLDNISIHTDRKWWGLCCCRKKTVSEMELEKRIKRANQRIIDSLDVLSIVRNFNQLKVLTHFFFEQHHFDLAQYVGFDLWQAECDEIEKRKKATEDGEEGYPSQRQIELDRRNLRKVHISQRILTEKQRFNQWIDYIRLKHRIRPEKEQNQVTNQVSKELDEFYYQKLYPNHGLKTTDGMVDLVNELMRIEVDPGDVPSIDADDRHPTKMNNRRPAGYARPDTQAAGRHQLEYRDEGCVVHDDMQNIDKNDGVQFDGFDGKQLAQRSPENMTDHEVVEYDDRVPDEYRCDLPDKHDIGY